MMKVTSKLMWAAQLLLIMAIINHRTEAAADAVRRLHRPLHHNHNRHIDEAAGSWRDAEHRCRKSGQGGLLHLTSGEDDEVEQLAQRVSELSSASGTVASCYWIRVTHNRRTLTELSWLMENYRGSVRSGHSRCHCAIATTGGFVSLRAKRCGSRLPFLCQRPRRQLLGGDRGKVLAATSTVATIRRLTTTIKKNKKVTSADAVAANKTTGVAIKHGEKGSASVNDADTAVGGDDYEPDESMDHAKFDRVKLGPDGHPEGWLPPWAVTTPETATAAIAAMTSEEAARNSTDELDAASSSGVLGKLGLLMEEGQRSEFVTLLVLYSVVAVICMVLLGLCIVRCCRGCFGRAKIRYVRQVDADDIPRFMPSSWA